MPVYDPRLISEQLVGREQQCPYGVAGLPADSLGLQPQPQSSHLRGDHVFSRDLGMPHLGPPYMPQRGHPQYAPMDHRATEQQLAELFSSQLDLLGPPLVRQLPSYQNLAAEEQYLGEGSAGHQDGEEKPRSKMQEKNRRVSASIKSISCDVSLYRAES